jgi:ribosome-binding ATPase YchF (GTP1/OBG family)
MLSELLLNDLIAVERKVERLADERKKGGTDKALNERQTILFTRLLEALNNNIPLRKLEYSHEEQKELASFGLLSRKPVLVVFNMGEAQSAPQMELDVPSVALMGKLEMEMAQLSAEDAAMFMEEYGIKELSLNKMISLSYELLQVQSFFTVGEDEVRAWETKIGATARSTPISCADSSGRRWWLMTTSSASGRWLKRSQRVNSGSRARNISSKMGTSSTSGLVCN